MFKFAHIGDCHIGANREPALEKLELEAFNSALEICIREKVDFIIITGDLFHANLPDMHVVNEAVKKMKDVKDSGIPIYVIYGSHDYSPNGTSIIDILDSTGLIQKIVKGTYIDDKISLEVFTDTKTNAKLVGMSARRGGLERNYFGILDTETLEKQSGFKIFAFHSAISELKPAVLAQMDSVPVSLLPKHFDYYAGGHIHKKTESGFPGHERIVFPGTLFAGYSRDLEDSAKGETRGFYIVAFDDKVTDVRFHEVNVCKYEYFEFDATNKNSLQAKKELFEKLARIEVNGSLVVVKIKGELSGGRVSEINTGEIRGFLREKGALDIIVNRYGLTSKEYAAVAVMGEDVPSIESKLLRENIGAVRISIEELKADKGTALAADLLRILRQEQKLNENKKDYLERIQKNALSSLRLGDEVR